MVELPRKDRLIQNTSTTRINTENGVRLLVIIEFQDGGRDILVLTEQELLEMATKLLEQRGGFGEVKN